jgi:hypothetical protein
VNKKYLRSIDGIESRVVFSVWFGTFNQMSANRIIALNTIFQKIGCPLVILGDENYLDWQHPDYPIHTSFQFLSSVHKSDYLRAYLMCFYGGGYTDIKSARFSWMPMFDVLQNNEDHLALGYPELRPTGIAEMQDGEHLDIRERFEEVIGMCAFLMRKRSPLSCAYLEGVEDVLDCYEFHLKRDPARFAYDNRDGWFTNSVTGYPLRWTSIGSEVFHKKVFDFRHYTILEPKICPVVTGYR